VTSDKLRRPFAQVDVFTAEALMGNPVAVVLDGSNVPTERMQTFTHWTNLSEATFVDAPSSPGADYSVRIFCPGRELPFAGHPTLGTCHAWLEAGGVPRGDVVVQECGAGLVRIKRGDEGRLAFAAPPRVRSGPLSDAELRTLTLGLGLTPADVVAHQWCDNGPGWQAVLLSSVEVLHSVRPDPTLVGDLDIGLVAPTSGDVDFEVRALFPGNNGITEDPVTGSLNAAIGQWFIESGVVTSSYTAVQGTALGRRGVVSIDYEGDDVWVGGQCVTVVSGTVTLGH
jgi:PhzF family phenazine biosynthesis protein